MPCVGKSSEICGAANALSIYKAVGSGACTNAKITYSGGLPASSASSSGSKLVTPARKTSAKWKRELILSEVRILSDEQEDILPW